MQENHTAGWLRMATSGSVVRRALGYAVIVGAILIAIKHGDAIVAGTIDYNRTFKMALTVLVPYCVSTASSVGALRSAAKKGRSRQPQRPIDGISVAVPVLWTQSQGDRTWPRRRV